MHIREATEKDSRELLELQTNCNIDTGFKVSLLSGQDFFSKAKAYENYKVFVAVEKNRIISSLSGAIRNATINKHTYKIGYEFYAFTFPDFRRRGIFRKLHQYLENYMINNGVVLSYCIILTDNIPSNIAIKKFGYNLYCNFKKVSLFAYKNMEINTSSNIRTAKKEDLNEISKILNETWRGYDFYEQSSSSSLADFIERTPDFDYKNILIFEKDRKILACLSYWRKLIKASLIALSFKSKFNTNIEKLINHFKKSIKTLEPDTLVKQILVTKIGYKNFNYLLDLFRFINNIAFKDGFNEIIYIKDHLKLNKLKDFTYKNTHLNLYIKTFIDGFNLDNNPIYIDTIDAY